MDRKEKAIDLNRHKFNCAQSVLCALSDFTDLDEEALLAVAGGFGTGVNSGEICGAVSGAVMAIGLADRFTKPDDLEKKKEVGKYTREFIAEFKNRFGYLDCRDLKDPEKGRVPCPELIAGAVEIAEEMLKEIKKN